MPDLSLARLHASGENQIRKQGSNQLPMIKIHRLPHHHRQIHQWWPLPSRSRTACKQPTPDRGSERRVVTAVVPVVAVPRPHHQPARCLRGWRCVAPHDARAWAGRVRCARGRRRPGVLPQRCLRPAARKG
jgi:hypothetical protein